MSLIMISRTRFISNNSHSRSQTLSAEPTRQSIDNIIKLLLLMDFRQSLLFAAYAAGSHSLVFGRLRSVEKKKNENI